MSTKHKSTTRLSLVTQLTTKLTEHITFLEDELSQLTNPSLSSNIVSEEDWLLSQLSQIRLELQILDLKERYLTRANHRLRQRIKHTNHQLTTENFSSLSSLQFLPSQSSLYPLHQPPRRPHRLDTGDNNNNNYNNTPTNYSSTHPPSWTPYTPSYTLDAYNEDFANVSALSLTSQMTPSIASISDAEFDTDASIASQSAISGAKSSQEFSIYDKRGRSQATISLHGATLLSWKVFDIDNVVHGQSGSVSSLINNSSNNTNNNNNSNALNDTSSVGINEKELIFISKLSFFDNIHPIRGGIPICFPQFAMNGKMPLHGFARILNWKLKDLDPGDKENDLITLEYSNLDEKRDNINISSILNIGDVVINNNNHSRKSIDISNNNNNNNIDKRDTNDVKIFDEEKNKDKDKENNIGGEGVILSDEPWNWDHKFKLEYSVRLSDYTMYNTLIVSNLNDSDEFEFTMAFHNYFKINNINNIKINGLDNVKFYDKARKVFDTQEGDIKIDREIDRIYTNCIEKKKIILDEDNGDYKIIIKRSDNLKDIVVFNPWIAKAKAIKDFGADEYNDTVAVETGSVTKENTITLKAGHSIVFTQEIQYVPK